MTRAQLRRHLADTLDDVERTGEPVAVSMRGTPRTTAARPHLVILVRGEKPPPGEPVALPTIQASRAEVSASASAQGDFSEVSDG